MPPQPVGTVKAITLYPVKSMRGVPVSQATLYWYGLDGDRKYAFVQDKPRSSFPWLTAREMSELLHCQPNFVQPGKPVSSEVAVTTSAGETVTVDSAKLREALKLPETVSLLKLARGTYDCMPVSILTTSQLLQLETHLGAAVDPRRFRANILIDNAGMEDEVLPGSSLRLGERETSARVLTAYKTQRCQMINLNAETGKSNPIYLKEIATLFEGCLGIYASVQTLGDVRLGDTVFKEER